MRLPVTRFDEANLYILPYTEARRGMYPVATFGGWHVSYFAVIQTSGAG